MTMYQEHPLTKNSFARHANRGKRVQIYDFAGEASFISAFGHLHRCTNVVAAGHTQASLQPVMGAPHADLPIRIRRDRERRSETTPAPSMRKTWVPASAEHAAPLDILKPATENFCAVERRSCR